MSISDKLTGKQPVKSVAGRRGGRPCLVARIVASDSLTPEDAAKLKEVIDAPPGSPNRLTNVAIVKVLRSEGFQLSIGAMDRHRQLTCGCYYYNNTYKEQE